MNLFKRTYYTITSGLPLRWLDGAIKGSVLLPYQHVVSDQALPHIRHIYPYKNIKQFRNDLDTLLKDFVPVSAEDVLLSFQDGKPLPRRAFLLSFDDGFREIYDIVAPELYAKGIPAVYFVCPAFLGNQKLFYRNAVSLLIDILRNGSDQHAFIGIAAAVLESRYPLSRQGLISALKKTSYSDKEKLLSLASLAGISFQEFLDKQQPYMTVGQVSQLAKQGFSIGAHSWDHPNYKYLETDEQIDQTSRSVAFVKEQFGQTRSFFAFPHADSGIGDDFFRRMDQEHPYIDLYFGVRNLQKETGNRVLHRFNAERPSLPLKKQLNGLLLYSNMRNLTGKGDVKR